MRCSKPLPYRWKIRTLRGSKRKKRELRPFFVLDALGGTLGMNVHSILLKFSHYVKKTTPQTSAPLYLDSKLHIKELNGSLSSSGT